RSRVFAPALALLVTADLFSFGGQIYSLHDPRIYTARPSSLEVVAHQPGRFPTPPLGPAEDPEEVNACLAPDTPSGFGLERRNGFDSLMLKQVDEASGGVMPTYGMISGAGAIGSAQFERFVDLLGARLVLMPAAHPEPLPPVRYQEAYRDERVVVYENA